MRGRTGREGGEKGGSGRKRVEGRGGGGGGGRDCVTRHCRRYHKIENT